MYTIGFDIGTTTICAIVVDSVSGKIKKSLTLPNGSFIETENAWEKIQDPEKIIAKIDGMIPALVDEFAPVTSIGVTGQMHGIVYLDENGRSCSPLYIWQDGRGNLPMNENESYCESLKSITGYKLSTGYGLVTHYYNLKNGLVPKEAKKFCTIHDYAAMHLAGLKTPVVHSSDAASFGVYNLKDNCFDVEALAKAGIDVSILPEVTASESVIGTFKGVPVTAAIGDNQASFLGSVSDIENGVLVNMGTGSQTSAVCDYCEGFNEGEIRPFVNGKYLLVGSSLCGGRAYAILENFFREYAKLLGCEDKSQYKLMDMLSEDAFTMDNKIDVKTTFSGTRADPSVRGSISGLSIDNLTPKHLVVGVLEGTVNELYDFYDAMKPFLKGTPGTLVGSGNGLRKSKVWQHMFEVKFGMELSVPAHNEEAAYGSALFSLVAVGEYKDFATAQKLINYIED